MATQLPLFDLVDYDPEDNPPEVTQGGFLISRDAVLLFAALIVLIAGVIALAFPLY